MGSSYQPVFGTFDPYGKSQDPLVQLLMKEVYGMSHHTDLGSGQQFYDTQQTLMQQLQKMGYQPGESMAQFQQQVQQMPNLADKDGGYLKQWLTDSGNASKLQGLSSWGTSDTTGGQGNAATPPTGAQPDWYSQAMQRLSDFANQMNTVDPNDPLAKSIGNIAYGQGSGQVGAAGFGAGGISANAGQRAYADAETRYQMQRQQMGQQALGQLQGGALQARGQDMGQILGLGNLALGQGSLGLQANQQGFNQNQTNLANGISLAGGAVNTAAKGLSGGSSGGGGGGYPSGGGGNLSGGSTTGSDPSEWSNPYSYG